MLRINETLSIPDTDLEEHFVQASGPGGQNVNKVATAVELRFDVRGSTCLERPVKDRLARLAGRRMTAEGVLVLRAERFRSQMRNRADARERLADLIRHALVRPRRRIPTRPSAAAKRRRREAKARRSALKQSRRTTTDRE